MAKYYGKIGFEVTNVEVAPSVYDSIIKERLYTGDIYKNYVKQKQAEKSVDDFTVANDISIVADPYALNNFSSMKYVEFMGTLWEVENVMVEYPRLRISIGGVYHGPTANAGCGISHNS